jgi:hypothetical protein
MKRLILACVALALVAAPVHADLRYTMHVEVRDIAPQASRPPTFADDILQKLQQGILQAIAPGGSGEASFAATDEALRVQYGQATPTVPRGGVLLKKADGSSVVLDPAERTYRKLPRFRSGVTSRSSLRPEAVSRRTGEFVTVSGLRAERVAFSIRLNLPAEMLRELPAGLPDAFTLEGDVWVTDQLSVPAPLAAMTSPALRALGLDDIVQDGFVVRQIIRGTLLGPHQVETTVTHIDSSAIQPELLQIPPDYREARGAPPDAGK